MSPRASGLAGLLLGIVLLASGCAVFGETPGTALAAAEAYFVEEAEEELADIPDFALQPAKAPGQLKEYRAARVEVEVEAPAPVRIEVPSLGVDSDLESLGLASDGSIEVPQEFASAGWYTEGPTPGQQGPAVILGHVDSKAGPAVFHRLRDLAHGAEIIITRDDGSQVTFTADRVERHAKTRFPTDDVYFPTLRPTLRLVTCGGAFDSDSGHYTDNVVAFAHLAS